MLRVQHEELATRIFSAVDDIIEMDTLEGLEVYHAILKVLNQFHPDYVKAEERTHEGVIHEPR